MFEVIEVLGQLMALLLIAIAAVGLGGTYIYIYIYIRTMDRVISGQQCWLERLLRRL